MDDLSTRQEIAALEARVKTLENIIVVNGLRLSSSSTFDDLQSLHRNGQLTGENPTNSQQSQLSKKRPHSIGSQQEYPHHRQTLTRVGGEDIIGEQVASREGSFEGAESYSEESDDEHSSVQNPRKVTEVCYDALMSYFPIPIPL